jgi:outer membrane receptor for ferric coprogen and ferric-rhodotorulic acid
LALALAPVAAGFAAGEKAGEPPAQLSPFEVSVDQDRGYAASSAMSGSRTNEKLGNQPNSISVMTQDLLQDLAFNNFFDTVEFATNAENIYNDSGTIGTAGSSGAQNRSGNQVGIRGLTNVRQLRDGFPWHLAADVYNTERIEFSRGPGGLADGDIDASGVINIVTQRATFQRTGSAQVRWEPFKDHRTQIDAMYETGNTTNHLGHLQLVDSSIAFVPGTGTNAPDADPV